MFAESLAKKKEELSEADKMFEELDFQKSKEYSNCFWYEHKKTKLRITFWKEEKSIGIMGDITIQILQAINKKVEELGWNEQV